jgi:hypothetical protein
MGKKIDTLTKDTWIFYCPGCKCHHMFDKRWKFNGDFEKPTLKPSYLVKSPTRCHSFITEGKITFLKDSKHLLSGMTIGLPDVSDLV